MLIYIIGGLIPLLIVSLAMTYNTKRLLMEQAVKESTFNARRLEERLDDSMKILSDVSDSLYLDKELERILKTQYEDKGEVIKDLNNFTKIDDYLRLNEAISSIRVYTDNHTLLNDSQLVKLKENDIYYEWYRLAKIKDGRKYFVVKYDNISRSNHLALVRLLKRGEEALGVLVINMNQEYLKKIISLELYQVIVTLDSKRIFLSTEEEMNFTRVSSEERFKELMDLDHGIHSLTFDESKVKVIKKTFQVSSVQNKCQLMVLIPMTEFSGTATKTALTSGSLIVISSFISILLVFLLSRIFTKRLYKFRTYLHKVATGDFTVHSDISGGDEIGELSDDLNVMITALRDLIHEVYEVRIQKEQLGTKQREAEFKMLASQINPHFLYNTLESIRMKALISGDKSIAEAVKKLAKIMRRNLSISNQEELLKNEMELVSNYLEIQQFRFGDKITFHIQMDTGLEEVPILPFLIQPIVENAFVHGLEKKIGGGHIQLNVKKQDEQLLIKVSDNGMGMSKERLHRIKQSLQNHVQNIDGSIGLANVNQRIHLFYGGDYGIQVNSQEGEGTQVEIHLPVKREVA